MTPVAEPLPESPVIRMEQVRPRVWLVELSGFPPVCVCGPSRDHAFDRAVNVCRGLRAVHAAKILEQWTEKKTL